MSRYNLRHLTQTAQANRFNRDTLEKVLRLSEILKVFNLDKDLKDNYVLKGGTAINLCLFDFPRLSVDIDMNFNVHSSKEEMLEMRNKYRKIIGDLMAYGGYTVDSKSRFSFTLDSYLLKYTNAAGGLDNIKIELNYSNRIQVLKPVYYPINASLIDNETVFALDKVELYGSKIAALVGRTTARDMFDTFNLIRYQILEASDLEMLKKISLFYLLLSNDFQPFEELLNQFEENVANMSYNLIKRNLIPLLHVGETIDIEELKNIVMPFIKTLFNFTEEENQFIGAFNAGEFKPELLFDQPLALRIREHPMALWKMKNHIMSHSS